MLIDTSGWFCALDERDERHESAAAIFASTRIAVTHRYVIAELVALCHKRRFSRSRTLAFLTELFEDGKTEIVWVDERLTRKAFDLLKNRRDKDWSLCDAVSFAIMREMGFAEALTTDHHFEQAGFIKLLQS